MTDDDGFETEIIEFRNAVGRLQPCSNSGKKYEARKFQTSWWRSIWDGKILQFKKKTLTTLEKFKYSNRLQRMVKRGGAVVAAQDGQASTVLQVGGSRRRRNGGFCGI